MNSNVLFYIVSKRVILLCFIGAMLFPMRATCNGLNSDVEILKTQARVTGVVNDKDGPLPGAQVLLKGTSKGVITDFDGNYAIDCPADAVLEFSYTGFITQEIQVEERTVIGVTLVKDDHYLEEYVVTGYGMKRKTFFNRLFSKKENFEENTGVILDSELDGVDIEEPDAKVGMGMDISSAEFMEYSNLVGVLNLMDKTNYNDIIDLSTVNLDDTNCPKVEAETLNDLIGKQRTKFYSIDTRINADTKFLIFFQLKAEKGDKIFIKEYMEYKELDCPLAEDGKVTYGVGVRLVIKASNISTQFDANVPSEFAAVSTMQKANVSYDLMNIGFNSDETRQIMSNLGSDTYNVENFQKVMDAYEKIVKSMKGDMKVHPEKILNLKEESR